MKAYSVHDREVGWKKKTLCICLNLEIICPNQTKYIYNNSNNTNDYNSQLNDIPGGLLPGLCFYCWTSPYAGFNESLTFAHDLFLSEMNQSILNILNIF